MMIPLERKFNVLINWLLIISLILSSNIKCQRDDRAFESPTSSGFSRDRAAHVDASASRYNSNNPTSRRPIDDSSSLISSSLSIVSSVNNDDEDSIYTRPSANRPIGKLFAERGELPEMKEQTEKNVRRSSSQGDDEDDEENGKNVRSDEPTPRPMRSQGTKKSRTPRPPSPPSTTPIPQVSSTPYRSTRTPTVLPDHRVINNYPTASYSSSPSSPELKESRPILPASSNVPKSTKHPLYATPCGANITLSSQTTRIVSPGWKEGDKYPPNVKCIWVINVLRSFIIQRETAIRVKVKRLEIEQDDLCAYDHLEIQGYKKLCGFIENKEIVINASSLVITFHSDSNNEDRGFELELYSLVGDCKPELIVTTNSGQITSPGFPNEYPLTFDCWTLINAKNLMNSASRSGGFGGPENLTISVTFEYIDLEPDKRCNYDYVELFAVNVNTKQPSTSLGKFCDENSLIRIVGTNGHNADSRIANHQPSTHLLITRPSESLSPHSSSSLPASPRPFPSPTVGDNLKPRPTITTKGPYLYLHFVSDGHVSRSGFKASYKIENDLSRSTLSDCDWTLDESNTITSPQFPKPYPPNKDCSLTLKATRTDEKIILIFESFLMEIDSNCSFDRLEIYDDYASIQDEPPSDRPYNEGGDRDASSASQGSGFTQSKGPTKIFCGHKSSKFKYVSSGPSLKLRFVSDKVNEDQGFVARYKFIQSSPVEVQTPKPIEIFAVVPQNASIVSGSSHLLFCVPADLLSNFPPPEINEKNVEPYRLDIRSNQNRQNGSQTKRISWFKDGQLITEGVSENGTKLLIHEFSKLNVGRYTCKYGSATADAWLKVQNNECGIVFRSRPADKALLEGEVNHIFACEPISLKRPNSQMTINWTKNGKKINNTRIEILRSGYLSINKPIAEDMGHYFCIVRLDDDPDCVSEAGAQLDVKSRVNIDSICGQPNLALPSNQKPQTDNTGKIVGGSRARKGAYPWQVMFWDVNRKSFCGGSLLNERWIATAAHCFAQNKFHPPPPPLDSIQVRLGKNDQEDEEEEEFSTKIDGVIKHPDYNPDTYDNDLALIRVKKSIPFTDYIKPICLGGSRAIMDETFFTHDSGSFKMGHVTGWGQLKESGGQPRYLQEIRMPIVDQFSCRKATSFAVTENMFCAGYAQEIIGDACKGDSGGPFVAYASDRWYLLGIVSWGEGCGRTGKYGYYTKVSNYIDWIKGLIKS